MMLATFVGAICRSVLRRRWIWAASTGLLSVLLFWASSRLTLRLNVADFLPNDTQPQDDLPRDVLRRLAGAGRLAIILESDTELSPERVAPIFSHLASALGRLNGVRDVRARLTPAELRFSKEFLPRHIINYLEPGALRAAGRSLTLAGIREALLEDSTHEERAGSRLRHEHDPLGLIRVAAAAMQPWQGVSRVRLVDGYYALPGGRTFFLTLESDATLDDITSARALVDSVHQVLSAARANSAVGPLLEGTRLYAVGRPVSFVTAYDTLYRDVVRVTVAAVAVVALLLALFFRRLTAPVVLFVPVALGFLAAAASAVPVFGTVSLIAWVFIGLMVGLGVDFGIHVAAHYWIHGEPGRERAEALASALSRPGWGILLGGLTSAAAFLAVWLIPYPAMHQVAWLTAVGLLAILGASFTVLPLVMSFSAPTARVESGWARWAGVFTRGIRIRPMLGLAPWALLVTACLVALPSLRFEPHPWRLAVRGNPESARLDRLSQEMGSAFTPLLIVSTGRTDREAIARDREAVRRLHRVALRAGVALVQSLGRWLPSPGQQRANLDFTRQNPGLFSSQRFRQDFEATVAMMKRPDPYLLDTYLPLITQAISSEPVPITLGDLVDLGLGDDVGRHLIERPGGGYFAVSYVFLRRFPWAEGAVSRFLDVSRAAGVDSVPGVTLAGEALRSAAHVRIIRRAVFIATLAAVVLVGGILWWRFRQPVTIGLCLAPLACGLSAALLLMTALGIELNLLSITIAPVLVGIGVDDGIHMVERLGAGQDAGTVLREAGSSMTITTLTTIGALACLAFATFAGIREMGLVGGVGLLVCLVASLHLIPLGWRITGGNRPNGAG